MSPIPTASDVKRHKWWGWGLDDVSFRWETKPTFARLAKDKVGLDLWSSPKPKEPSLDDFDIPESVLTDEVRDQLVKALGEDAVRLDDEFRVLHSFGRSLPDLFRARHGKFDRLVDAVVYPASEEEIQSVLRLVLEHDLVLIPYGGGSCISGSVTPDVTETRPILTLNLGRMRQVLEVDEKAGLARIQAGVYGPDLEEQLNARGWTMGHFPDSFAYSTLGGWAATRSTGMQSDKYGDIEDVVRGLRLVHPRGVAVTKPIPGRDSGPSVHEMVLGSEGRLGVISECTVQIHREPEVREVIAYMFRDWAHGTQALYDMSRSEATPTFTRISDGPETRFSLAMVSQASSLKSAVTNQVQNGLWAYLKSQGWDTEEGMCISYVCFEGSKSKVAREKTIIKNIVKSNGGITLGAGAGAVYDGKKFDTPYLRDFLLNYQVFGDVCETGVTWTDLKDLHAKVYEAFNAQRRAVDKPGFMFCHMSHSYHGGACLYFTFAIPYDSDESALDDYFAVKNVVQSEFIAARGGLSHHHGVGTEHQPWITDDQSEVGVSMIKGLFADTDPGHNLNPGKVVDG